MRSCKRGRTLVLIPEGREAHCGSGSPSAPFLVVRSFVLSDRDEKEEFKVSMFFCTAASRAFSAGTSHYTRLTVARPILLRILLQGPLFETRKRMHCAVWLREFKYFNYFLSATSLRVFVWKVPRVKRLTRNSWCREVFKVIYLWILKNTVCENSRYGRAILPSLRQVHMSKGVRGIYFRRWHDIKCHSNWSKHMLWFLYIF